MASPEQAAHTHTARHRRLLGGIASWTVPGALLLLVMLLMVPLPPVLLDALVVVNLVLSLVVLLRVVRADHVLTLSTLPTILLGLTLFRLALNVSSTRLILTRGQAGSVVEAFGNFVVRGDVLVGLVIFGVLTVVQLVVLSKGAERVAEVGARFALDAMPGRQMSIDADLRAGAFDLVEAQRRRGAVQQESRLYGSMDGAMKFVRGDAIAGLVMTVVNALGGLWIGVARAGLSLGQASDQYLLLTVGDGLVAQVPSVALALAAGLFVTRTAGSGGSPPIAGRAGLGNEVLRQLVADPPAWLGASAVCGLMAATPGLPTIAFGSGALASVVVATLLRPARAASDSHPLRPSAGMGPSTAGGGRVASGAPPPRIVLRVGVPRGAPTPHLVDLDEELRAVRGAFFLRLGLRLAPLAWEREEAETWLARVEVDGVPVVQAIVDPGTKAVFGPIAQLRRFAAAGRAVLHPTRVQCGVIVRADLASDTGGLAGCEVLDARGQLILWLAAAIQREAPRLVGLREVETAWYEVAATDQALTDALAPRLPLFRLAAVLRRLVEEGVTIRDLRGILEALAEEPIETMDVAGLVEAARRDATRGLVARTAPLGLLRAWMLSPALEDQIRRAIVATASGPRLQLAPAVLQGLLSQAADAWMGREGRPVVVAAPDVRRYVRQLLVHIQPAVLVIGAAELLAGIQIDCLGRLGSVAGCSAETGAAPAETSAVC